MLFRSAPPLLAKRNAKGELVKKEYGPGVFTAVGLLARLRVLRGGALDVFGYTAERRMERRLIDDYERMVGGLLDTLDGGNVDLAAEIAAIPEPVRGYGHVKEAHLHKIGRASRRDRVCQYVHISGVAVDLKKKKTDTNNHT